MKHKLIIIASILTLALSTALDANAQWVHTSAGLGVPTNIDILGFAVIGTNIFVGTGTGIYLSTDTGSNWISVNNSAVNGYVNFITASGTTLFADTGYKKAELFAL